MNHLAHKLKSQSKERNQMLQLQRWEHARHAFDNPTRLWAKFKAVLVIVAHNHNDWEAQERFGRLAKEVNRVFYALSNILGAQERRIDVWQITKVVDLVVIKSNKLHHITIRTVNVSLYKMNQKGREQADFLSGELYNANASDSIKPPSLQRIPQLGAKSAMLEIEIR